MENTKQKHTGSNILIIMLILIILASTGIGLYSWAKYQSTIEGTATGETAKWSFNVLNNGTSIQDVNLPLSRTDNNTSVAEGKIAPGTYGELEIEIDAIGTETALTYIIEATMENKPANLKFYSDAERTQELAVVSNKFLKGGYMQLNEVGKRTETIYWEWPFQTGTAAKNDELDTEANGKTMSMQISVKGEQLNSEPKLADLVQVGDYVNYDANSNGEKTFTSEDCANLADSSGTSISGTISTAEEFNSEANAQWRVIGVDRNTGDVELVAVNGTSQTLTLKGKDAFMNSETVLDNICAIYGQGKGAVSGRSIILEDMEKYTNYNPYWFPKEYSNTGYYGGTRDYTRGKYFKEINNGDKIEYDTTEQISASASNIVTVTNTYYGYSSSNYNSIINKIICEESVNVNDRIWYNTKSVDLGDKACAYRVGEIRIESAQIISATVVDSDGGAHQRINAVLPVVKLENNIKTTGQDANGVWQLIVD